MQLAEAQGVMTRILRIIRDRQDEWCAIVAIAALIVTLVAGVGLLACTFSVWCSDGLLRCCAP